MEECISELPSTMRTVYWLKRQELGLTLQDVADAVDISLNRYYNIENGASCPLDTMLKISQVLQIDWLTACCVACESASLKNIKVIKDI
jgi:DNA-binding XRE family transcriptional regulator